MLSFWVSAALHIVLGRLALSNVATRGVYHKIKITPGAKCWLTWSLADYVNLQIVVVASYIPLQVALAHVMVCMATVDVSVKLPPCCSREYNNTSAVDDDELSQLPTSTELASPDSNVRAGITEAA